MQIKIGLCEPNPGWDIILSQEGCCYERIDQNHLDNLKDYQLIIPNKQLLLEQTQSFKEYLSGGGFSVLDRDTWNLILDLPVVEKKVAYIVPEMESLFSSLGLIDFYTNFSYPKNSSLKALDTELKVLTDTIHDPLMVLVPFSVNELIAECDTMRKRFYAERKELPSEVVSRRSKREIRELLSTTLQYCFDVLHVPFVQKSFYFLEYNNTFIFRIDTDFCSPEDARALYELCKKYNIRATWFVDTQNEKMLSDMYPEFSEHEIALHCENHAVYDTYEQNYNNIAIALDKLQKYELYPKGFAAPFGEWNPALGEALESFSLDYSSEFALDYDDLPFFPYFDDHFSPVLQIPIHPISVGRLRRSHFSDEEMIQYYQMIINYNFSKKMPVILYHHPHHQKLQVWEKIFAQLRKEELWNPTMYEFSLWWKERTSSSFSVNLDEDSIYIDSSNQNISYRILDVNKGSAEINATMHYKMKDLEFHEDRSVRPNRSKRMRSFHWRDVLYNFEQKKSKKRS